MMGKNQAAQRSSAAADSSSQASTNDPVMAPSAVHRSPPAEKPEATRTRSLVIFAFWAVILFLGIPMWWKTTSIYRANLPLSEMEDWSLGKACKPVFPLHIHVYTPALSAPEAESLVNAAQHALDDLNDFSAHHLRLRIVKTKEDLDADAIDNDGLGLDIQNADDTALTLRLLPIDNVNAPTSELNKYSERLDIFYPSNQAQGQLNSHSPLIEFIAGELRSLFNEEKATLQYILSQSNMLGQSSTAGGENDKDQNVATTKPAAPPQSMEAIARQNRKSFKYAETYHLSFSLFTPGVEPSSWDIEPAIQEHLTPLLKAFAPISNFTIDTQVQLYATFSPTATPPEYDESEDAWTLKKEDLSGFINAAEWPLSPSIGRGPTINFILYVPSPYKSPLVIKENQATSWLIPQWGGVVILNPPVKHLLGGQLNPPSLSKESLEPAIATFAHQLLSLLGTPSSPPSLPLRLQSLIRIHTASLLLSASSTMGSLARLTRSLPSIPIPVTVATSISRTLSHLSNTCALLQQGAFKSALANARVAENEAERSFFEKSMVGQAYFPDEHKVAVYLPLLGPIGVPLILGLVKETRNLILRLRR